MSTRLFGLAALSLAWGVVACINNDDKAPIIPPLPESSIAAPTPTPSATSPEIPDAIAPPADAMLPPLDAGPDARFATGLGAGAVVTKSAKYTLITKTGGSPGGHGMGRSPTHTVVSGAASGTKK